MSTMEFEQVHCFIQPRSYLEEFQDYSLEATFSLSPNTTTPDYQDLERFLQLETTDLMEFDSIVQDADMGPEICKESTLVCREIEEGNDSPLKGIQEELMEESSVTDLLLMGAEAVEAQNWSLSSVIITKLRDLLIDRENGNSPFNRLALFFTQGLLYKSIDAPGMILQDPVSMSSFQILQELSPCVKFAHFTANQAIVEATQGDSEIHVIDFDILDGIQWPPLMVDLARRNDHVSLRVTAIITDPQNQAATVHQTGRRLKEFSDSIDFSFQFDQMVMEKEGDFEGIKTGKTLIANCMIHQLHMPKTSSFSLLKTFLNGMTKLSPKMVVLVEEELFRFAKTPSMSFVDFFCEALHHYTALSDSLLSSFSRKYKLGSRQIEEFLGIRILDSLRQFPCKNIERISWGEDGFASLREFKPITLSSWNISQAKLLVALFSGGYWVQHDKCRLVLCWKSRPLTTASIWVPISKPAEIGRDSNREASEVHIVHFGLHDNPID